MAWEFKLPDLGEGVVEGEIVKWLVKEGDRIGEDQPMVEVMTDKATVEIPSPRAGVVAKIHVQEGKICRVGQPMLAIEDGGNGKTVTAKAPSASQAPSPSPSVPTAVPAPAPAPVSTSTTKAL